MKVMVTALYNLYIYESDGNSFVLLIYLYTPIDSSSEHLLSIASARIFK